MILQGQEAVLQDGAVQHRVQVQQVEVQKKLSPKVPNYDLIRLPVFDILREQR